MAKLLTYYDLVARGIVNNRTTLDRRIKRKQFPRPIRIGLRNNAWIEDEVDAWEAERVAERDEEALTPATQLVLAAKENASQHSTPHPIGIEILERQRNSSWNAKAKARRFAETPRNAPEETPEKPPDNKKHF